MARGERKKARRKPATLKMEQQKKQKIKSKAQELAREGEVTIESINGVVGH